MLWLKVRLVFYDFMMILKIGDKLGPNSLWFHLLFFEEFSRKKSSEIVGFFYIKEKFFIARFNDFLMEMFKSCLFTSKIIQKTKIFFL